MDPTEQLKKERSTAKRGVTTAAKRLEGSCRRGQGSDIVTTHVLALESALDDFLVKQEDYEQHVKDSFNRRCYSCHET